MWTVIAAIVLLCITLAALFGWWRAMGRPAGRYVEGWHEGYDTGWNEAVAACEAAWLGGKPWDGAPAGNFTFGLCVPVEQEPPDDWSPALEYGPEDDERPASSTEQFQAILAGVDRLERETLLCWDAKMRSERAWSQLIEETKAMCPDAA